MKYRVHRVDVEEKTAQQQLEQFLNQLRGPVLAVVPYVVPVFRPMGATSKIRFLLVVERLD